MNGPFKAFHSAFTKALIATWHSACVRVGTFMASKLRRQVDGSSAEPRRLEIKICSWRTCQRV